MSYVNYEFYTSHFSKLSQEEFDKRIDEAESFVDLRGRKKVIDELKANEQAEIADVRIIPYKMGVCRIAEALEEFDGEYETVNSVSNGGYSESYLVQSKDEKLNAVAKSSFSGAGIWGAHYV